MSLQSCGVMPTLSPHTHTHTHTHTHYAPKCCFSHMRNVRAHFLKFADPYSAVVDKTRGKYDWSAVDRNLAAAAKRGRHSVVRFWATYPSRKSGVPTYIRTSPGYNDSKVYVKGEELVWGSDV